MSNPNSINSHQSTFIEVDYAILGMKLINNSRFVSYQFNAFVECSLSETVFVPFVDWPV